MSQVEGTVRSLRSDQEGQDVVLRFVLEVGEGDRLPVEMRGHQIRGVLEVGDKVRFDLEGQGLRDADGVARPGRVDNLSTNSVVRAPGSSQLRQLLELGTGFLASVFAGIVGSSLRSTPPVAALQALPGSEPAGGSGGIDQTVWISVLVGLAVMVVVFYLIYLRPRLE